VLVTRIGDLLGIPRGFIVNFVLNTYASRFPNGRCRGADVQERLAAASDSSSSLFPWVRDIAVLRTRGAPRTRKADSRTHGNRLSLSPRRRQALLNVTPRIFHSGICLRTYFSTKSR